MKAIHNELTTQEIIDNAVISQLKYNFESNSQHAWNAAVDDWAVISQLKYNFESNSHIAFAPTKKSHHFGGISNHFYP